MSDDVLSPAAYVIKSASGQTLEVLSAQFIGSERRLVQLNTGPQSAGTYTIRAEIIGFQSVQQEVTVTAGGAATVDFALSIQAISMDELVVTGTAGSSRRREVGNSVAAINTVNTLTLANKLLTA